MVRLILILMCVTGCQKKRNAIPVVPHYIKQNKVESEKIIKVNKGLVKKALNYMHSEQYYSAEGGTPSQCFFTPYSYRAFKRDNSFFIELNLSFAGDLNKMSVIRKCLRETKKFYNRYDIKLAIHETDLDEADYEITLFDEKGRSTSIDWYIEDDYLCSTVIHEVGHLLGLPDEYSEEKTCREKKYIAYETNPYSIMANSSKNLELLQLMPRHIVALIEQAIQSEVTLEFSVGGIFKDLFPKCKMPAGGVKFQAGQTIQIIEGVRSEYVSRQFSENLYFEVPMNSNYHFSAWEWFCEDLHRVQSFQDWSQMFEQAGVEAKMKPLSFEDHSNYPPLFYERERQDN